MQLRTFMLLVIVALMAATSSVILGTPQQQKAAGSSDPISGEWDASFVADGTTALLTLEFQLNGDKVTGKALSAHTGPGTISKGTWTDNKLSFTLDFVTHDSIAVTGALKDGKLIGEFRTEGFQSKWEAQRKAVPAASSVAKPPVDYPDPISGEWDASFEAQSTAAPITFKLKLAGDRVTGTSESAHLGSGTVSKGLWASDKLSFTLDSGQLTIAVTGRLQDGKLVGEFDAGVMHGKWEAVRK
jgi:hypothetical protein